MPDDLTDAQISLLCAIEEHDRSELIDDRKRDMERLLSEGYVEQDKDDPSRGLQLTAKGITFLGERGAGLNEA